jgi:hypothetical protein
VAHVKHGNLPLDAQLIIARHTAEKQVGNDGSLYLQFACDVDMRKSRSYCWVIVSTLGGWVYGAVYLHAPTIFDELNDAIQPLGQRFVELDAAKAMNARRRHA